MKNHPDKPSVEQNLLSDILGEAEKAKVKLTPEIEQYIRDHLQAVQAKLDRGEKLTTEDFSFIDESKRMIAVYPYMNEKFGPMFPLHVKTLEKYGLLEEGGKPHQGDSPIPSIEKALLSFSVREYQVIKTFKEPILLLVPTASFARVMQAINSNRIEGQAEIQPANEFKEKNNKNERITNWRCIIVDSNKEWEYEADTKGFIGLEFNERLKTHRKNQKPGERGMDRMRYSIFAMELFRKAGTFDKIHYEKCVLDDDPSFTKSRIPFAWWDVEGRDADSIEEDKIKGLYFLCDDPNAISENYRFRSSVGGDIPL